MMGWDYEYDDITGGFRVFVGAVSLSVCTESPLEDAAVLSETLHGLAAVPDVDHGRTSGRCGCAADECPGASA